MTDFSENEFNQEEQGRNIKEYFNLIRNNITPVLIIVLSCFVISIIYAVKSKDIYKSTTSLKISKPKGNVLQNSLMPDIGSFTDDRFLTTEIEIMKSRTIRESVAEALLDSVKAGINPDSIYVVLDHSFSSSGEKKILSTDAIAGNLEKLVNIEQKKGMDIVDISVESPSAYGSAMIANIYAKKYKMFNLEVNRNQLTTVREFLQDQAKEKQQELQQSESSLSQYQSKNGIIALDDQSKSLISQLADFEAKRDGAKIDLTATEKMLGQLKDEMKQQNPKMAEYIENLASQSYFKGLQDEIAKLQINKELVSANDKTGNNPLLVKQLDDQIAVLKKNLDEKTKTIKTGLFATNPEAINDLTAKILDAEVKEKGLVSQLSQLNDIVKKYESQFNKLPQTAIGYAELARRREASEKLFSLIEEKYQEALINEQSEPGNVFIIDGAVKETIPAKPNRQMIILMGLILGIVFGVGFVVVKDFFDDTIKSPDDLENKNINLLAWIPVIESLGENGHKPNEFIVAEKPDAQSSEAFKALRTRVQYSKVGSDSLKTILVTSPAPGEGKTTVAVNLAGVFAQADNKVLLVDLDLRKPRIHNVFKELRYPGLIDYFFGKVSLEEIMHSTKLPNLSFITVGTIPPNPSELLGSKQMAEFLKEMKKKYDLVIIDSAPIIAVTDSEILARMVDATILVASAESTEMELVVKATKLLQRDNSSFIGVVLNKFSYKAGYGSYYKYYYYYSDKRKKDKKDKKSIV